MYTIDKLPSQFNLGKQGETGVMSIQIDCSAWYALWPSGAPAVQFSTGGDPVLLSQASVENQILTIDVLLNMTAIAGSGTLLIRFIESGIEKRSVLVDTYVSASYALTNEPMPDPVVDWVNAATSKLGELDGRNIVAAEFVGDNLVFTKTNTDEVVIVGAKTTLKGDKGETGEIGPKGNAGNKGEIGNTGPQGQTGPQGTQGIKGNTGAKGDIGLTGPKGDKGDKGDQGATGAPSTIPGPRGYTGFRGEEGPRGSQGIQGEQGYSAYEVWKRMPGNTGKTENQYIASLKYEALEAANVAYGKAELATTAANNASGNIIKSVEFGAEDIIFTKENTETINLVNAREVLKGDNGVYVGSVEPTDPEKNIWIDEDAQQEYSTTYEQAVENGYTKSKEQFFADLEGLEGAIDGANSAADIANASALAAQNNLLWRRITTNPASFYPVPQSPLYVRASGEPIQTGIGDPAPDNIRPILPWKASGEAVKVRRTGKNLFDVSNPFAVIVPGHISSGEFRTNAANAKSVIVRATPGKQYALSKVDGDRSVYGFFSTYPTGGQRALSNGLTEITGVSPADAQYLVWFVASTTSDLPTQIQIEEGTVITPYEPYSGEEITLTAPQDIYGGWMDNEGRGLITHANIPSYAGESVPTGWKSSVGSLTTGAQVVYPLAVPTALTITPKPLLALPQADRTVPRLNVVATDAQGLQTDYAKSPIQESNEQNAAIVATGV